MNSFRNISQILDDYKLNLSFYFSEAIDMPLAKPYWVYINASFNCNFNCQMCGVKKILRGQELSLSMLQNVFGEIAKWKSPHVITLTGGEPFLRQDIFESLVDSRAISVMPPRHEASGKIDPSPARWLC